MCKILPEMGKLTYCEMVPSGIDLQQTHHKLKASSTQVATHKNVSDIIPENNLLWAMIYISKDNQWYPLAIHFLYGQNSAICGGSNCNKGI